MTTFISQQLEKWPHKPLTTKDVLNTLYAMQLSIPSTHVVISTHLGQTASMIRLHRKLHRKHHQWWKAPHPSSWAKFHQECMPQTGCLMHSRLHRAAVIYERLLFQSNLSVNTVLCICGTLRCAQLIQYITTSASLQHCVPCYTHKTHKSPFLAYYAAKGSLRPTSSAMHLLDYTGTLCSIIPIIATNMLARLLLYSYLSLPHGTCERLHLHIINTNA